MVSTSGPKYTFAVGEGVLGARFNESEVFGNILTTCTNNTKNKT